MPLNQLSKTPKFKNSRNSDLNCRTQQRAITFLRILTCVDCTAQVPLRKLYFGGRAWK